MLHDARHIEPDADLACDLCIVGAGAAGIALARACADTALRVCVLESGGRGASRTARALAGAESVGRLYYPVAETRQRRFGGTTGWWSGECRPLDEEEDLAPRPWLGLGGWPVDAAELAPFYERAQSLCGLCAGPFDPAAAWLAGRGGAPLALDERRFTTRIFKYSAPIDFADAYGRDLDRASNVDVLLDATAAAIETDASGRRALGVRVLTAPGRAFTIAARAVVLAGGGIENARLLLASTATRPAGVGNDHDQVGRAFMEHLFLDDVAAFKPAALNPSLRLYGRRWTAPGGKVRATVAPTAALLAQAGILHCCFKLTSPALRHAALAAALARALGLRGGPPLPPRERTLMALAARLPAATAEAARLLRRGEYGTAARPRAMPVTVISEQAPNPDSRITLSEQRDPLGQPLARLDWRLDDVDRLTWSRGLDLLAEEIARAGLGQLVVPDAEERDAALQRARGGRHHMGTTRMADDPRRGVVDRHVRVHGLENLFVAGSSVFPTSGHANPTLTIVALALRLADHLTADVLA